MKAGAGYIDKGATISKCGRYRYRLWREWRLGTRALWHVIDGKWGGPKSCVFAMLNPSTADGEEDDPTIRRCVGFAKRWGYDRLEVINLFAYRTANPKILLAAGHADNPVGVENQEHVQAAIKNADVIICAWGCHGSHLGQDETFLGWLPEDAKITCLGLTADGHPRHPLYLPSTAKPVLFTMPRIFA
jgi:hypothetical protein